MKKLYAIITKDRPEARIPRTTNALYTSRKKAEAMLNLMKDKYPKIIWGIQEWHEAFSGEYFSQNI